MTTHQRHFGANIPAWNRVVEPHEDIVQGQLSMDTYAVNLAQLVQGDSRMRRVYRDPQMFFEATYLTTGLRYILKDVMAVLAGELGDHILQLRTPFGGGKTHTLLALYHLARSRHLLHDIPGLDQLPDPGPVRVAVISGVGTGAADTQTQRHRTLWGELASQLGEESYQLVAVQDQAAVAPGGEVLAQLIGQKPTLLLLDELLVYVENALAVGVGESNLGRQTILFLQRLTEAVSASPHAALVYSLQASKQEAGGNQELLAILEKIGQRLNVIREPVSGEEVLRVVQRRLFANLGSEMQRQQVANAYSEGYRGFLLAGGFSQEQAQRQADFLRERILLSYPFHPDLLDLMRERWSSLPSYQRTRGALQFLATAVRALWHNNVQTQPLLGPGDVPLSDSAVRTTFLSQVGETTQYDAVLQADLLGPHAGAREVDERLVRESPHLQAYLPGTRIATAALLYSFGGSSQLERGVFENELLSACLAPGLDRNILQTALHDLNDRLLYLHQRERRYRFETQPNLNKLILDESQRRSQQEIEDRMRIEFSKAIGEERDAVVWPPDTEKVRDRIPEFQIVYLSPRWLDEHQTTESQIQGLQQYIEYCGNMPRRFHNGLTLAVPNQRMLDDIRNAVRMVLTLELLYSQRTQLQLTEQQAAELQERKRRAEGELKGAFSQLYPIVYTPQAAEQNGQVYRLDELQVQSYSQVPQIHRRIKEALLNRVVYDSVQAGKIVSLTRLNEQMPIEHQFYRVSDIVIGFFSYYNWTHVWNEQVVRRAIAQGIKNRTFAYVANARTNEQGNLILSGPANTTILFGRDILAHELDMSENGFLLSAAYAQQLFTPPAQPQPHPPIDLTSQSSAPTPVSPLAGNSGGTVGAGSPYIQDGGTVYAPPPTPPLGSPVAPGKGGQHYRLHVQINAKQFFDLLQALERLNERSVGMDVTVIATAKPNQPFIANTMHNLIGEPLIETSDIQVLEERVEE